MTSLMIHNEDLQYKVILFYLLLNVLYKIDITFIMHNTH